MRRLPIEFHGDPELPVVVVQIACPTAYPADGLAFRAGKSMAPFDAANIVPLQHRVDAFADVGKCADQFGAPSQPRPCRH